MKVFKMIILLSVLPAVLAGAAGAGAGAGPEAAGGGEQRAGIPFLFQVVPLSSFGELRIEADVNIGLVAAGASSVGSFQFAPGFSAADEVKGIQSAGVLCWAERLDGCQIGIFNVAGSGNGCQIGVFNFSDDPEIRSVGLFNFHRDSRMEVLLFADSAYGAGAAFLCGLGSFYSCYSAGLAGIFGQAEASDLSLVTSLTAGMRFAAGIFFADAGAGILQQYRESKEPDISALVRVKAGVRLFDLVSLFAGASLSAGAEARPSSALFAAEAGPVRFGMSLFGGAAVSIGGENS